MKLLAVTACSGGIAHTYMAAEALQIAAKEMGIEIKVETQGSIGAENVLTNEEIKEARTIIIATNIGVNKDRFIGKRLIEVSADQSIKNAKHVIEQAAKTENVYGEFRQEVKTEQKVTKERDLGPYKHLMAGVSYMIPFVVLGGISIAIAFALGGIHAGDQEGTLAAAFMTIGGGTAFGLMFAILSGYIAFSIADRPGIVPGMVGGMLVSGMNAGFLGALISGFLAGYVVLAIKKYIKVPKGVQGLMPILIIPLLSGAIVGLAVIYIIGGPFNALNEVMTVWLQNLSGINGIMLGAILGVMMAVDMAGAIGKAAYFFGVASLTVLATGETSTIMAAVMAAGMVPPLGMALATVLFKNKFSMMEKEAGKAAWVLGISFITEGAIPFAAADPLRVLPSCMLGSAVTGALSMAFKCGLAVPHGGLFVLPIPGATHNLPLYFIAILCGAAVTAVSVSLLKKKVTTETKSDMAVTQ
ncbi:MAG: PTS fructose transporter subunit IIC [Eubacteriales bacterium]